MAKKRGQSKSGSKKKSEPSSKKAKVSETRDTGYVDLIESVLNLDTTGTCTLAATIPQGASVNQRVGKRITLKNIQIKGLIHGNSATTATFWQVALVYDRIPTGGNVNPADVFANPAGATGAYMFAADNNAPRFKVLRRWTGCIGGAPGAGVSGATCSSVDDFVTPKEELPMVFKALGTGAVGDIAEGALWLVGLGGSPSGTSAATGRISVRVRWLDNP